MNLQPVLENENVLLQPLVYSDFDHLYEIAADPEIWAQHPSRDRYKKEVFEIFFQEAMQSGGAFLITDKKSGEVAGSSRFYNFNPEDRSIFIGYTFYARKFWGSQLNPQVKQLMLDYIFQFVDKVYFQVGRENFRSQKAVERLGAVKIDESSAEYPIEPDPTNLLYQLPKTQWLHHLV